MIRWPALSAYRQEKGSRVNASGSLLVGTFLCSRSPYWTVTVPFMSVRWKSQTNS